MPGIKPGMTGREALRKHTGFVIPGRSAGPDPESRPKHGARVWIPGSRFQRAPE
jgi:hypothetical protein